MRSPTESSMSSSRSCGRGETWWASATSSSVVWPIAETTATTLCPRSRASTRRRATRRSFSASPTDVPPNFITSEPRRARHGLDCGDSLELGHGHLEQCREVSFSRPSTLREWVVVVFGAGGLLLLPWTALALLVVEAAPHHRPLGHRVVGLRLGPRGALRSHRDRRVSPFALGRRMLGCDGDAARHGRLVRRRSWRATRTSCATRFCSRSSSSCRPPRSASGSRFAPSSSSRASSVRRSATTAQSHLAAAREGATESDLVGVLEVASDREPAREPGHSDSTA